ncbi:MAG TPA: sodium:proton antiporter [Bacteroides sp.]|nr:sodium:proton antiporter [Bacteroides sp.]
MFVLMVVVFLLGYLAIALEHPLHVDKAIPALMIGTLLWVLYIFGAFDIFSAGLSEAWNSFVAKEHPGGDVGIEEMRHFIVDNQIIHHLGEISEILFFLLGAMTIVEITDQHDGFKVITDRIRTTSKVKLLWVLSILTFFMSAVLDNLTTTIVMVALLRKLVSEKETRWFFASMIVLAANAGGAWSPIGDVTTIMLWIGGQVTTVKIILRVILPSLVTLVIPLVLCSFIHKGCVTRPLVREDEPVYTTPFERKLMLVLGVSGLLFVPVFKTITHLPPYQGMLLSLSVIWLVTELLHHGKSAEIRSKLKVVNILRRVEFPTIFFFLGILLAVAALQSAGQLTVLATWLDENLGNIYLIDLAIGLLSAVVDNVPLVAGAMGMYPIVDPANLSAIADPAMQEYMGYFVQDGLFWEFLAYCAGTGGSILIIGSAAGVAAMGMEKIDFIWYLKKISLLALLGYLAGAAVYFLQAQFIHH